MKATIKKYQMFIILTVFLVIISIAVAIFGVFLYGRLSNGFDITSLGVLISTAIGVMTALLGGIAVNVFAARRERRLKQLELTKRYTQQEEEMVRLTQQKRELELTHLNLEKQGQMLNRQLEAINLTEKDPRLAIVIAFQGLEEEVDRAINQLFDSGTKSGEIVLEKLSDTFSYKVSLLKKYIGPEKSDALLKMRDLRNRIVHGEVLPGEVSQDRAKDYVQQAVELAKSTWSIEA